jgi:hypothetical protein
MATIEFTSDELALVALHAKIPQPSYFSSSSNGWVSISDDTERALIVMPGDVRALLLAAITQASQFLTFHNKFDALCAQFVAVTAARNNNILEQVATTPSALASDVLSAWAPRFRSVSGIGNLVSVLQRLHSSPTDRDEEATYRSKVLANFAAITNNAQLLNELESWHALLLTYQS